MLYLFIAAFAVSIGMLLYWYWQDEVQRREEERNSNYRTCRIEVLEDRCYLSGVPMDEPVDYYEPPESTCDYYYSTSADGSTPSASPPEETDTPATLADEGSETVASTLPSPVYYVNLFTDELALFDGDENNGVQISDSAMLAQLDAATNLTMAAVFNVDSTSGWHYILTHDCNNNSGAEVFLRIRDGKLQFGYWDSWSNHMVQTDVSADTWYEAVGTFDGTTWKLYLNGEFVNEIDYTPEHDINELNVRGNDVTQGWFVGRHGTDYDRRVFGGVITEVAVFDTALTEEQIIAGAGEGTDASDWLPEAGGTAEDDFVGTKLARNVAAVYAWRNMQGILSLFHRFERNAEEVYQFNDDGHVWRDSNQARKQFLVEYAIAHNPQANITTTPTTFRVNIDDWTSIWNIIPRGSKNNPGYDFSIQPDGNLINTIRINEASFWLGSMEDFQVRGAYTVTLWRDPANANFIHADISSTDLNWRWVDEIDAHHPDEYNWNENSHLQGYLEAIIDRNCDQALGANFYFHVNIRDTSLYMLTKLLAGNVTDRVPLVGGGI